jgi:ferredoxin-thioredoxin reductase catalytic subunit
MDEENIVPLARMPIIPPRPCRAAGATEELDKDIICVARVKPEHNRRHRRYCRWEQEGAVAEAPATTLQRRGIW